MDSILGLKRKMRHELGISAGQEAVAVAKEQAEAKAFLRSGLQELQLHNGQNLV